MTTATPKFIADAMLGRLAKWLRLLGVDTVWQPDLSDTRVLRRAHHENRILLTRDTRLLRRRGLPPHLYIRDDDFRAQLRAVVQAFAIDPLVGCFGRCSRCNVELQSIATADVRDLVPRYVWNTQTQFAQCTECRRIYWAATHTERIRAELARLTGA